MRHLITIAALTLLASGCATVTRGTNEAYAVETDPAGARVQFSNGLSCTSPCSVQVKRKGAFTVTIEKDGYETVNSTIQSSVDGGGAAGMAGNVLVGGIIGAGIDAGTGAMHSHKPNPLVVKMVPLDGTTAAVVADKVVVKAAEDAEVEVVVEDAEQVEDGTN